MKTQQSCDAFWTPIERHPHGIGASRVAHWLLEHAQQAPGSPHAGGVAGWIGVDGRADHVYPEITGYYLQWLAWIARRHGRQIEYATRAAAASRWLAQWLAGDNIPATRIHMDSRRNDWRNDALFAFDVAMVLRGIASAVRSKLIDAPVATVERLCHWLSRLIGADGEINACLMHGATASFPQRWSTQRGSFLAKAAVGILDAADALPDVPLALREAAERTFDASVDAFIRAPHNETHPFLYAIEGFLALPKHPRFSERLAKIVERFDALLARANSVGHVPETFDGAGKPRLDIVAQTLRAGLLLNAHPRTSKSRPQLRHFADTLTQCIRSDGAVPFAADVHQFNVWTAMFADQALAFADGDRYEIARIAAAPSIV